MAEKKDLKGALGSTKDNLAKVARKVSGQEFKQEFRDYTDAVAAVSQGLWAEQQSMERRLLAAEKAGSRSLIALAASGIALLCALVALGLSL